MSKRVTIKKSNKGKIFIIITILVILMFGICSLVVYYFDKTIQPTVMLVAQDEIKGKAIEIINKNALNIYSEKFNYNEMMNIQKDNEGNIILTQADTVKLNALATELALSAQKELEEIGSIGVKMPMGYISKNNIMSYWGPKINVKMEPLGRVETSYESTFESAGINQTRHKIYLIVKTKVKIILPLVHNDVEVTSEIPISETIIVGRIPENALGFDFKSN